MSPMAATRTPTTTGIAARSSTIPEAAIQLNKPSRDPRPISNTAESFLLSNRPSYQARIAAQGNDQPAAAAAATTTTTPTLTERERRCKAEAKRAERRQKQAMAARIASNPTKPAAPPRSKFFARIEREQRQARAAKVKAANRRIEMRPGIPLAEQRRPDWGMQEARKTEAHNHHVATSEKAQQVAAGAAEKAERRRLALQRANERAMAEIEAARERDRQEYGWKTS
ncbi:hypothetical protein MCOR02_009813 [Pyricularia oryzae]|uniref:Uncharacterized protein n=1 Tax=Pyricularia oryzae TaxID=318829 RepID=A0A4P7N9G4_PYROR|nr:hypothetical protein MCOR02_009813 [Pyricularia oryzae]KAI6258609.1 hypothetical protein MCOR19_004991 [Pyricularia oryzae]KAI6315461.1 hypothetical protein MCOR34_004624 [Pyricularia oryzae]KAI6408885.1 hypothetical protein MCOR20_005251 [Pyricularia oryzae]KAI6426124.1 hypothetical protein MCOR24_002963 [Pyricularia oryzae]